MLSCHMIFACMKYQWLTLTLLVLLNLPNKDQMITTFILLDVFTNQCCCDKLVIELYGYKLTICFDNSKNKEEEELLLNKEIKELEMSIERRKKLLSNENYVNKAPSAVVEKDRDALSKEKERLEFIESELSKYIA